jgi:dipeptidase D
VVFRKKYKKVIACLRAVHTALICGLIVSLALVGGCAQAQTEAPETVTTVSPQDVLTYYQSIITFPRSGPSYPGDLNSYLLEQAEILDVEAEKDDAGNVVMHVPATGGSEAAQPVVLLAYTGADIVNLHSKPFDPYKDGVSLVPSSEQVRASGTSMGADGALGIATILSVLKFAASHGEITAVFASGTGDVGATDVVSGTGDVGASDAVSGAGVRADALSPTGILLQLPENALLIETGGADTDEIIDEAPMATLLTAKTTASAMLSDSNRAYVISASGFPKGAARVNAGKDYISPVSVITKILSEARNAGCVYQLCNFTGGSDACALPAEAQAVVILGDYEERQFREVFESVAEESMSVMGGEDSGADVSMIETVMPGFAINEDNVSNALTYLYGIINLNISDPGNSDALLNIGEVKFDPSAFECNIAVVSAYPGSDTADDLVSDQSAIERLSGIPVEKAGEIPGFSNFGTDADEAVPDSFLNAYKEVTGGEVARVRSGALSPLGELAVAATVKHIGITVHDRETPEEYFEKDAAAIPANVILRYIER